MDAADELVHARLKLAQAQKEERKLREALVAESASSKRYKQAVNDVVVLLAPLRRLLVTLEADGRDVDFVEARELVRASVQILNDALDNKPTNRSG